MRLHQTAAALSVGVPYNRGMPAAAELSSKDGQGSMTCRAGWEDGTDREKKTRKEMTSKGANQEDKAGKKVKAKKKSTRAKEAKTLRHWGFPGDPSTQY
jgi:hypothetical protein